MGSACYDYYQWVVHMHNLIKIRAYSNIDTSFLQTGHDLLSKIDSDVNI